MVASPGKPWRGGERVLLDRSLGGLAERTHLRSSWICLGPVHALLNDGDTIC